MQTINLTEWELSYYESYNELLNIFRKARNCFGLDKQLGVTKELIQRKCNHMVDLGLMAKTQKYENKYKNSISYYISIVDVYPMDVYLQKLTETKEKLKKRYEKTLEVRKEKYVQGVVYLNKYDQLIGKYILIDVKEGEHVAENMVLSVRPKSERVYVSGAERI